MSSKVPTVSEAPSNADTIALARTGKKQVLERRFGFVAVLGFSCSVIITWEGMILDLVVGLNNGGPAGLVYGYLVAWLGSLSVFIAMGELTSMMPTAGGQYHWTSILAPDSCKVLLSYVIGWTTVVSWVFGAVATAFLTASITQYLIALSIPSYSPEAWQGTLMTWAVILYGVLLNTTLGSFLPYTEILIFVLHVMGFFATLFSLVWSGPRANVNEIFTKFFNNGGWQTQTLSFFIGLKGNVAAFVGSDASIHMVEEVRNATVNVPTAIVYSLLINGLLGFGMLIAILFSASDLDALATSSAPYPFIQIYNSATRSTGATIVLASILVVMNACSCLAAVSSASRLMWSFSRERAVPGWHKLRKVSTRTSIPTRTVLVTGAIAMLVSLISIGSSLALEDLLSLALEGFYTSYLIPLTLLLWHRCRGNVKVANEGSETIATQALGQLEWGPWRVKGMLGLLNNVVACVYLTIIVFFAFWPAQRHITASSMNYSILVLGFVVLVTSAYYFIAARKQYKGPILEVEDHAMTDIHRYERPEA